MIEKRASPRHRVLKQGTIAFRGGGGIDCMVRNLSQGGARLEVATPFGLHGSFTLVIATDDFMRPSSPWSEMALRGDVTRVHTDKTRRNRCFGTLSQELRGAQNTGVSV